MEDQSKMADYQSKRAEHGWRSADRRVGSDVERVPFDALRPGDIFRLVNPDGSLVETEAPWMRCIKAPMPCEPEGNMILTADPYNERAERIGAVPRCAGCEHFATEHLVDDEERRECFIPGCVCVQFEIGGMLAPDLGGEG